MERQQEQQAVVDIEETQAEVDIEGTEAEVDIEGTDVHSLPNVAWLDIVSYLVRGAADPFVRVAQQHCNLGSLAAAGPTFRDVVRRTRPSVGYSLDYSTDKSLDGSAGEAQAKHFVGLGSCTELVLCGRPSSKLSFLSACIAEERGIEALGRVTSLHVDGTAYACIWADEVLSDDEDAPSERKPVEYPADAIVPLILANMPRLTTLFMLERASPECALTISAASSLQRLRLPMRLTHDVVRLLAELPALTYLDCLAPIRDMTARDRSARDRYRYPAPQLKALKVLHLTRTDTHFLDMVYLVTCAPSLEELGKALTIIDTSDDDVMMALEAMCDNLAARLIPPRLDVNIEIEGNLHWPLSTSPHMAAGLRCLVGVISLSDDGGDDLMNAKWVLEHTPCITAMRTSHRCKFADVITLLPLLPPALKTLYVNGYKLTLDLASPQHRAALDAVGRMSIQLRVSSISVSCHGWDTGSVAPQDLSGIEAGLARIQTDTLLVREDERPDDARWLFSHIETRSVMCTHSIVEACIDVVCDRINDGTLRSLHMHARGGLEHEQRSAFKAVLRQFLARVRLSPKGMVTVSSPYAMSVTPASVALLKAKSVHLLK